MSKLNEREVMQFSRYLIRQHYFGLFEGKTVVAMCQTKAQAEMICDALRKKYAGRPFEFDYELKAEYDKELDELHDLLGKE